jgi:hypothetical protein
VWRYCAQAFVFQHCTAGIQAGPSFTASGDIRLRAEGLDVDARGDLFIIGEGGKSLLLRRQ